MAISETILVCNQPPRPTQPPTLSRMENVYWPKCSDALQLGAANAVFGKIGRFASEEVVLKIIHSKCVPILLYGLEACPLNKADLN